VFKNRGFTGAELAYRTQRPADRADYIAKINRLLPAAQSILARFGGEAPGAAASAFPAAPQATAAPAVQFDPALLKRLAAWQVESEKEALQGRELPLPAGTVEALRAARARAGMAQAAPAAPGVPAPTPVDVGGGGLFMPLTTKLTPGSEFNRADGPEGVDVDGGGNIHGGKDWFAPAGSGVFAPLGGTIVEVRASRGNSGQVFGGVVKLQDPSGRVFVFRHVDPTGVKVGQTVGRGSQIASVSPWKGGSPHAHIEVWRTLGGGYRASNLIDPVKVFGGG
jgi:murein DD-endopeptidase MepM/ murein hydrolase activator NlpD